MKIIFKILSVLLIIASAAVIIYGGLLIINTGNFVETANKYGIGGGMLGAGGMILALIGAFVIAVGALMMFTGINGIRCRMEKCTKAAFWLLILQAGDLILCIIKKYNMTPAVLWLLFFGVYYFLAKNYMKYDNTY